MGLLIYDLFRSHQLSYLREFERELGVGQRFQSIGTITGAPAVIYEVQTVFTSNVDRLRYARLVPVDDRTQMKSVVSAILLNPRHFIRVARPACSGSTHLRAA